MKVYDQGTWGFTFIFTCDGSVIPKSLVWGIPSAAATAILDYVYFDKLKLSSPWADAASISALWSGFTFVLGFLVVFRSQQAYSRYWEGASLLRQMRGEWLNAASSLIAFCTTDKERRNEVEAYQQLLIRLMSMLHSCALQTVADMEDANFERFSDQGLNRESLVFLADLDDKRQRCEILTQWIQRHICNGIASGVVPVAPPILSRVYQELSHGVVNLSDARKLTEIPFPFPISQLLQIMLIMYSFLTPTIAALLMQSKFWASMFTFCAVFSFTGVNYICMEIESPFGNDRNDLPIADMQAEMNDSLWILLERRAQETPSFEFDKASHRSYIEKRTSFSVVDGVDVRQKRNRKGTCVDNIATSSIKAAKLTRLATRASAFGPRNSNDAFAPQLASFGEESDIASDVRFTHSGSISTSCSELAEEEEVQQRYICEDEDRKFMDLPLNEVSPCDMPSVHAASGSRFTSQSARMPPMTLRRSAGSSHVTSHLPLQAPAFSPSPLTTMPLGHPQSAHRLDVKPERSLDERFDQGFTALRDSSDSSSAVDATVRSTAG